MYKFLTKNGQILAFGIGVLVVALFLISVTGGIGDFNMLAKEDKGTTTIFDLGLQLTIALLIICAIAAVLFGFYHLITNPKGAIKLIIGLVVLGALFFILLSTSEPETTGIVAAATEKHNVEPNESKLVSAMIKSTLGLGVIAILAFVVAEIRNFFK